LLEAVERQLATGTDVDFKRLEEGGRAELEFFLGSVHSPPFCILSNLFAFFGRDVKEQHDGIKLRDVERYELAALPDRPP